MNGPQADPIDWQKRRYDALKQFRDREEMARAEAGRLAVAALLDLDDRDKREDAHYAIGTLRAYEAATQLAVDMLNAKFPFHDLTRSGASPRPPEDGPRKTEDCGK